MVKLAMTRNDELQDNRQFFEQALGEILDRLYGTAYRLTRDKHDAEDLVADTVEKAIKNLDSFLIYCLSGTILLPVRPCGYTGRQIQEDKK